MPADATGSLETLLAAVRGCTACARDLPHGPRPVLRLHPAARLLIVSQAPGARVHESGVPWQDASGDRLRAWMGIDKGAFHDPDLIAILPMGFCYPGTGRSGDLPPRPECAPRWRARLLAQMPSIRLTLVIGAHALAWHLPTGPGTTLTATVRAWRGCDASVLPLPHPSPRNNRWLVRNPWFEKEVVPALAKQVASVLAAKS